MKKLILSAVAIATLAGSAYAEKFQASDGNKIESINVSCDNGRIGFIATITNSATTTIIQTSSCDFYQGKAYNGILVSKKTESKNREIIPTFASIYSDMYSFSLQEYLQNPNHYYDSSKYEYSLLEDSGTIENGEVKLTEGQDYGDFIEVLQVDKKTGEEKVNIIEIYKI